MVARLRNCQPQGRLLPGVTLRLAPRRRPRRYQDEVKPRRDQVPGWLRTQPVPARILGGDGLPLGGIGPVARRVTASISRDRDDVDRARLLDLAVLRREKARALLQGRAASPSGAGNPSY